MDRWKGLLFIAEPDAVKIIKLSRIADSRIETIQFYTVAPDSRIL